MLCMNPCPAQLSFALGLPVVDPTALFAPVRRCDVIPSSKRLGAESPLPMGVGESAMFDPPSDTHRSWSYGHARDFRAYTAGGGSGDSFRKQRHGRV